MTQTANNQLPPQQTIDGDFDYVIVGAGSAGCVLAHRLTENPAIRVCLLEAGGPDKNPMIHAPMGFAFMTPNAKENWSFETVPQKHLNNRRGFQPRGRVLGGSSSINAMIYIRGFQHDYDGWAEAGAEGWGWDDVLPYFKKAENNERGESAYHAVGGPLNVADLQYKNPLSDRFLEASSQLQLSVVNDFNEPLVEGVGYYQVTQKDGRRYSAARGYLDPVKDRPNLRVISAAFAEKVIIQDGQARGVSFHQGKERHTVLANGEVILSAGAFQSPQLLMVSGIGPADHLKDQGITVVAANDHVGSHLQDHLDYCILRKTSSPDSVGLNWSTASKAFSAWRSYKNDGKGMFTSNLAESGGFLRTNPGEDYPDVQLHFVPGLVDDHGRKKHLGGGFSCHICVLRPKSRGTVRLASAAMRDAPLIDPNFLGHDDDLHRLVRGTRLAERIFEAPALAEVSGQELYAPHGSDDETLVEDIRNRSDTIYHPVGTCRMGAQGSSVLDTDLKVRGVANLRVADASVMPNLVSGNTNAPSIMIGEKAADHIKQHHSSN